MAHTITIAFFGGHPPQFTTKVWSFVDLVLCLPYSHALYDSWDQMIMYLTEKLEVANQFKCLAVVVLDIKIVMILQQNLVASVASSVLHAEFKCTYLCTPLPSPSLPQC